MYDSYYSNLFYHWRNYQFLPKWETKREQNIWWKGQCQEKWQQNMILHSGVNGQGGIGESIGGNAWLRNDKRGKYHYIYIELEISSYIYGIGWCWKEWGVRRYGM